MALQAAADGARRSNHPPFTLEILADLLLATWRVEARTDRLPDWDVLRQVFIGDWDGLPRSVQDLLHVQRRADGDVLHEETAMVMAAQRAAIISRINHRMREQMIRLSGAEALLAIWDTEIGFPAEVEWMRERVRHMLRVDAPHRS